MGYYKVTVIERLAKVLIIEADNLFKAVEKAETMVNKSEVVLDADDFVDRNFEIEEPSEQRIYSNP